MGRPGQDDLRGEAKPQRPLLSNPPTYLQHRTIQLLYERWVRELLPRMTPNSGTSQTNAWRQNSPTHGIGSVSGQRSMTSFTKAMKCFTPEWPTPCLPPAP